MKGTDLDKVCVATGYSPLHFAATKGLYDMVEFLLDQGVKVNNTGGGGIKVKTPLEMVITILAKKKSYGDIPGGVEGLLKVQARLKTIVDDLDEQQRIKREQAEAEARSLELKQNEAKAAEEAKRSGFLEAKKRKLAERAAKAAAQEQVKLDRLAKIEQESKKKSKKVKDR